jgi:hypothetical protein
LNQADHISSRPQVCHADRGGKRGEEGERASNERGADLPAAEKALKRASGECAQSGAG